MLAGVCGGLGRRLGIDPVLLRVVAVVLAVFGGVGLLLYALAWLLVPAEGEQVSIVEQALGRGGPGRDRGGPILLVIGLGLLALVISGSILDGRGEGALLLGLAVVGGVLLLNRQDRGVVPAPPGAPLTTLPPTGGPTDHLETSMDPTERATAPLPPQPPGSQPTYGGPPPTYAGWSGGPPPGGTTPLSYSRAVPPGPPLPRPKRERSALTPITLSALLVAVGILGLADLAGAGVPAAAYVALSLAVIGTGLVVGAWYGRGPSLVVLGVLVALVLLPASAASRWDIGRAEDVTVAPTSLAEVPSSADHGAGRVVYDLSAVDFRGASTTLNIDHGVGELVVVLPSDVDVRLRSDVGIGQISAFGTELGGLGNEHVTRDLGLDGPGGGTLDLRLDLGIGNLEVRREAS